MKEDLHKDGMCFGGWGVVEFDHKQDAEEALQRCASPALCAHLPMTAWGPDLAIISVPGHPCTIHGQWFVSVIKLQPMGMHSSQPLF